MTAWHESTVCADVSELFDKADQGARMTKTKTFEFYLYQTPYGGLDEPTFSLTESKGMEEHGWMLMHEVPVTVELPEAEDVRKIKLRALDLEEQALRARFAARITELQQQKNELLAIENEVAA